MAKKAPSSPAAPPPADRAVSDAQARGPGTEIENKAAAASATHEEIARAAYLRWCAHGGDEAGNWLAAERALKAGRVPTR